MTRPTETYSAMRSTANPEHWCVIQRRWRKHRKGRPRPAPIERIVKIFTGPDAETQAYAYTNQRNGRRDRGMMRRQDRV